MRCRRWISAAALLLSACGGGADAPVADDEARLEAAAIARGLVREAADAPLTGLFVRDNDRMCLIEQGAGARIGIVSDYDGGGACAAAGAAIRNGGGVRITLGAAGDCTFDAAFDGNRIAFPARLPAGCRRFCSARSSLSAVSVTRLSDSAAEAAALRDNRGRLLCDG
ncbi:hypothetical protein [Sphingomonas sp.]|uniref:hypothetical protein n=1 Tax=Sphingomonas sp. TaxID=28214 RepID=UPI002C7511B0|nr:hypothetical protein [Sphingomonas sp.]HTG37912.1 hypothetical protein [Sphingomonas sp.]